MKRPRDLNRIPLVEVLPLGKNPMLVITMGRKQWDEMLATAYADGWVLLEVDRSERPFAAYRREDFSQGEAE